MTSDHSEAWQALLRSQAAPAPALAVACERAVVRWASWWRPDANLPVSDGVGPGGAVQALALARLGDRPVVLAGARDGSLWALDVATGAVVVGPMLAHSKAIMAVAAADLDGRPVGISASADRFLQRWDLATGSALGAALYGHTDRVWSVSVTNVDDGAVIVSAGRDKTVRVWGLESGASIGEPFRGHASSVRAFVVDEWDGRPCVLSPSDDGVALSWDLMSRSLVSHPLAPHLRTAVALTTAIVSAQRVVLSGHTDGRVQIWNARTGTPLGQPLVGYLGPVRSMSVCPAEPAGADGLRIGVAAQSQAGIWDFTADMVWRCVAIVDSGGHNRFGVRGELLRPTDPAVVGRVYAAAPIGANSAVVATEHGVARLDFV